tara:strand:+ start:10 stop:267 length:258 start_codon:yes stop_codon:yes gene_type:complete
MAYKQPSSGPFKMMGSSPAKHDMVEDVKQADGSTKQFPVKHKHKMRPKTTEKPTPKKKVNKVEPKKTKVKPKKYKFPPIGVEVVI